MPEILFMPKIAKQRETSARNVAYAAFGPRRNVAFLHIRAMNHDIIDKTTMDFGKRLYLTIERIVDFRLDHGAEPVHSARRKSSVPIGVLEPSWI